MSIWRFYFDLGPKRLFHSTRFGGHMVPYRGKRVVASHLFGRVYFICDYSLYNEGLLK